MAPPFLTRVEGLSAQTVGEDLFLGLSPNFGPKTGLNLSEDLFFFDIHLILGRKTDWWKKIYSGLRCSQIF